MPVEHYENFPVASILLPRRLRQPVAAFYHFARAADDIADEGDLTNEERLQQLNDFRDELNHIAADETPQLPLFKRLAVEIKEHALPMQPFRDLLDAFSQDVVKKRYSDYDELLDYCRRSANPVGNLLLHLYEEATSVNIAYSDAICTALQLINFWQDVARDHAIGRIYLPQDEMAQFGVTEDQISQGQTNDAWRALMRFEVDRTRALMLQGAPLGSILTGRIGLEMRMIIAGGLRILDKLEAADYDMFRHRPVLRPLDWVIMLAKSAPLRF
ncbi:squalene synthase HpnC [Sideroxydans lithotrophicus]|uniref:Squalene synthase HpnC n=1 Tax=Sideroxydans lithotrophicus (strain ES-1) TaxID=580332 RepID=D5CRT8_SIDLE|nr:squalene synthase HpnC [Sideroxydans lithotrophicus]ADE11674.1 squalene synthase HpnC [Sideroxydans lithotrophicus ES-1]